MPTGPSTRRLSRAALALAAALAACGGDTSASGGSGNAPATPRTAAALNFDPAAITPRMVALGDSIFHGKLGASSCQACHGEGGKNGAAAPDLTDGRWLHSDGSLEGIFKTIKTGVMTPKEFMSVMPPYGGVQLSDERTLAVAAYVYKLANP